MTGALAAYQDAFARVLFARGDPAGDLAALVSQPGFAVYRNTVMKGCVDALQANYPAVLRLVGEEWFRAAAAEYARAALPDDPVLLRYGAGFADFLRDFPPAGDMPYLEGVARLDRFWTEAHSARDAGTLPPDTLARMPPDELAGTVLHPHPAARWTYFAAQPIYTIWRRNREQADGEDELVWVGEGALLTRPEGMVRWQAIDAAGCAFLDACAREEPLSAAAVATLEVNQSADLARLIAMLLESGAISSMSGDRPSEEERR